MFGFDRLALIKKKTPISRFARMRATFLFFIRLLWISYLNSLFQWHTKCFYQLCIVKEKQLVRKQIDCYIIYCCDVLQNWCYKFIRRFSAEQFVSVSVFVANSSCALIWMDHILDWIYAIAKFMWEKSTSE